MLVHSKLFGNLIDFFSNLGFYKHNFPLSPECTRNRDLGGYTEISVAISRRIRMNYFYFTYRPVYCGISFSVSVNKISKVRLHAVPYIVPMFQ